MQDKKNLEEKLKHAQQWMKKSVENSTKNIQNEKILLQSLKNKSELLEDSIFNIIADKILNYFDDIYIAEIDEKYINYLIKSELAYYLLLADFPIEPLSIAISYNKIIDYFIEINITRKFKTFAKNKLLNKPENIFREKRLYSTLKYDHSISMGVVSSLIAAKEKNKNNYYENIFWDFISNDTFLRKIFQNKNFIDIWQEINASEVFSEKRHL